MKVTISSMIVEIRNMVGPDKKNAPRREHFYFVHVLVVLE